MPLDLDVILNTISQPTDDQDPRESERFVEMGKEIEKLSSLSASAIPNWQRIEKLGTEFLSQQSKDFLVASWLGEAWTQRYAMQGVSAGLGLMEGLTTRYWEQAIPPLNRLRGRRNAMLWWIERLTIWLEKQTEITIDQDLSTTIISRVRNFDSALSDKDSEAPSLSKLISLLERIPVEALDIPREMPVGGIDRTESPVSQDPSTPIASPSPLQPVTQKVTSSPSTAIQLPNISNDIEINSLDDFVKLLGPAQDYISQIAPVLFKFDHVHPLTIYLTRFSARASILELPPFANGQTSISSPPIAIVDAFEKISTSKNALGLIDFCESRIRAYPFWLDLDYHSARGFSMMGSAGANMCQSIIDMVLAFVDRIPGIENLSFSNGEPFANMETLAWIKQCRLQRTGSGQEDSFSVMHRQAMAHIADGKIDSAQQILQKFIAENRSQREQFRARLALVQLSLSQDTLSDQLALLDPLIEDCLRLNLDQWEPELASETWQLRVRAAYQALNNSGNKIEATRLTWIREELDRALKHLSVVDFLAASRFVRG